MTAWPYLIPALVHNPMAGKGKEDYHGATLTHLKMKRAALLNDVGALYLKRETAIKQYEAARKKLVALEEEISKRALEEN